MNRREFLQAGAAGLALTALPNYAADFAAEKKRVGLIGSGWYGKCDLFRLIQVAPVEVVSLCGLNLEKDSDMVRVAPVYIAEFALAQDCAEADALFVSCGALRLSSMRGVRVACASMSTGARGLHLAPPLDSELGIYAFRLRDY